MRTCLRQVLRDGECVWLGVLVLRWQGKMHVEQVPVSPTLDRRRTLAGRDGVLRAGLHLPPVLGPVIGLVEVFDRPSVSARAFSLHEAEVAPRPVAVVLMRTVRGCEVAELARHIIDEVPMVGALTPLSVGRSAAFAVDENHVVAVLLVVVPPSPDGEVLAHGREQEVATAIVKVALRRGRSLRTIKDHKCVVLVPAAPERDDPAVSVPELGRRLGLPRVHLALHFVEGQQ